MFTMASARGSGVSSPTDRPVKVIYLVPVFGLTRVVHLPCTGLLTGILEEPVEAVPRTLFIPYLYVVPQLLSRNALTTRSQRRESAAQAGEARTANNAGL